MSKKRPQQVPELGSKKPLSVEQRRKGSWLPLSLSLAFAALLMHYVWHLRNRRVARAPLGDGHCKACVA